MENPLRTRINERFQVTGKNKDDAAAYIGKGRTYLYDFLTGKSGSMNFNLIPKLAEYLDCDPRYLTGEVPNPDGTGYAELTVSAVIGGPEEMAIPVTVNSDIRHPSASQQAFIVSGDAWDHLGISDGSIVIVTDAITPHPGSLVVARLDGDGLAIGKLTTQGIEVPGREIIPMDQADVIGSVTMEMHMYGEPEPAF